MQRDEFGRVCASLRLDHINSTTGKPWNQADLAENCNLSPKIIGQIERGEKVNLDKETLLRLAEVFHLTTVERARFFAFASNVDQEEVPRPEQSIELVLERVIKKMEAVQQPALLHDGYYRIVAINSAYMQVYGLTQTYLDSIPADDPTKYHIVRHIHDPESPVRAAYSRHLQQTEMNNLSYWRYLALGYRYTETYEHIQQRLIATYPKFARLWSEINHMVQKEDRINLLRAFEQTHPILGSISYTVLSNRIYAGEQELYLTLLVPTDPPTFSIFHDLVEDVSFQLNVFEPHFLKD